MFTGRVRPRRRRSPADCSAAIESLEQRIVLHQPHDPVSLVALSPSFDTDGEVLAADEGGQLYKSIDSGRTYHVVADPIITRTLTQISYSPAYNTDQTVLVGTETGGIYRSFDGGDSWTASATGMTDLHVLSIEFSPNFANDQTVFVGTMGGTIYKSVDGGGSWQAVSSSLLGPINDIEVSDNYAVDQTLLVSQLGNGVHRSNNGGSSFFPVNNGLSNQQVRTIAIPENFSSNQIVYAGTSGGVFVSSTGGNSWTRINQGLSDLNIVDLEITSAGMVGALASEGGVHIRPASGGNWTEANNGIVEFDQSGGEHYFDLAVSSTFSTDSTAFVATFGGLYRTHQPAPQWVEANLFEYRYNREVQISPDFATDQTIFAATYGSGLMKSTNVGEDWTVLSYGMQNLYIDNIAPSPNYASDQTLFSGNFLGVYKSTDGGATWSLSKLRPELNDEIYVRDLEVSPNFANDQIVLAGASTETSPGKNGFYRSTDGGETWTMHNTGLPAEPRVDQIEFSPNFASDNTVFVGLNGVGVYKSTDGGLTWNAANAGIAGQGIRRMRVSPNFASDQTLFAVTAGQLARSTDAGASWSVLDTSFVPGVTAVTISPDYATDQTVWIGAGPFGVFRSTDGGATWNAGSTGLEGSYVNDMVISPDYVNDGTLIVATTHGAYRTTDGGDSFEYIQTTNRYEDERDLMYFTGGWTMERVPGLSGPTRRAATQSARLEFQFYGNQIAWIGSKGPNHGMARVTLDGQVMGVVDLYDPVAQASVVIGQASLENGWHTLIIQVLGTRRAASSGTRVSVDAFDVFEEKPATAQLASQALSLTAEPSAIKSSPASVQETSGDTLTTSDQRQQPAPLALRLDADHDRLWSLIHNGHLRRWLRALLARR